MNSCSLPVPAKRCARGAFTLIELLIVIAIIVILIALLFPSLSTMRERANVLKCMSNMKQIASASYAYAVDHNNNLPRSDSGSPGKGSPQSWQPASWVVGSNPVYDPKTGTGPGMDGIHNGSLWTGNYLTDERVYRCPSYPYPDYARSYSWADYVTGDGGSSSTMDGGWSTVHSMLNCRNPSQVIWITEENPGVSAAHSQKYPPPDSRAGLNDGYLRCASTVYQDKPASYHLCPPNTGQGKCNVIFLDGHGATLQSYPPGKRTGNTVPYDEFYEQYQKYPQLK
jgi:prepilin-type N-terminal cleavage/methylation domain-containing protein/prepilin-type processing-associated H-X9-DG protein